MVCSLQIAGVISEFLWLGSGRCPADNDCRTINAPWTIEGGFAVQRLQIQTDK
jgi:hypothetical protein